MRCPGLAERKEFVGNLRGVMDGGVTSRPAGDTPKASRPKPQRQEPSDDARSRHPNAVLVFDLCGTVGGSPIPTGRISAMELMDMLKRGRAGDSAAKLAEKFKVDEGTVEKVLATHGLLVVPKPTKPGGVLDVTHLQEY